MTYRRVGAKVQVAGFADFHSYSEVVERASLGLGLEPSCNAQLIVSGGLVKNGTLNNGAAWSLGEYIQEIGGKPARNKKPSVSVFLNAAKYVHACMHAWFEITNCTSQDDSASEFLTSEHESLQAG